ncbi:MAG TPA: ABC transporter permease [Gammaproteobacteria bacterium]|nr:ABC transporter permease [Gammaproteobacteria bacterium]
MNGFLNDLRFGLRQLATKPGFAAAAILTLALGIGANTAVFSILSGYLFKPLPYPHAGRLAEAHVELPKLVAGELPLSLPMYQTIRKQTDAFAAIALYYGDDYNLRAGGRAMDVFDYMTTASLFQVLGVQPALGHAFTTENMHKGHNQVAVISYAMWRDSFGADPGVVGKMVTFASKPYKIIGVMPKGFAFPDHGAEMWTPMTISPDDFRPKRIVDLQGNFIGWLKPGVSADVAERQIRQAVHAWMDSHLPIKVGGLLNRIDKKWLQNASFNISAGPYRNKLLGNRPATLWLLQGAVLLILLITCVNVANLLLSRILGRSHEMAMRSALGATRATLARQLLGEALCLTLPGGLGGVALAWLGLHFIANSALGAGTSVFNIALDWRVGLFALGAVLFTAALVSVLPIRHLAKTDLQMILQEGTRTSGGGRGAKRTRNALVIAELTLATGLLAMAGLLLHSVMNIRDVNPGYRTDHMLIAHLTASWDDFPSEQAMSNVYKEIVKRVDGLPGVVSAGVSDFMPLMGENLMGPITIVGQKSPAGQPPVAMTDIITPGFFKTLGIPILHGRAFDERDTGKRRVIVDNSVVEKYFHGANPIGQQLKFGKNKWTIVGVVPPIKYSHLSQSKPTFAVYINIDTTPSSDMYLMVHTKLPPGALMQPVKELIAAVAPKFAVNKMHTMRDQMSDLLRHKQTTMTLLLAFGGIALALAIIGVYAVMSYTVGQRRAECGVRLALGAQPMDLQWLVLKDGLRLLIVGLIVGLGLAVLCGYLISAQLYGVAPFDPATLIASAIVLCVITLAACYLPARRAAKLDPAVAIMEQ